MTQIPIFLLIGYLIGSIPTAYIIVRLWRKTDIRETGSGNVGAANVFRVTESRLASVTVALIDVFKGIAAVFLTGILGGDDFQLWAAAGLGAVIGHNFPVWLKFKGGRGLATACGVIFLVAWLLPAVWGLIWYVFRLATKETILSNVIATGLLMVFVLLIPDNLMEHFLYIGQETLEVRIFTLLLGVLIIVKHIGPLKKRISEG